MVASRAGKIAVVHAGRHVGVLRAWDATHVAQRRQRGLAYRQTRLIVEFRRGHHRSPGCGGEWGKRMERLRIKVDGSMVLVAGHGGAQLPPEPDDAEGTNRSTPSAVVAGPEAIFVSGRVEHEAPTLIRIGDHDEADGLELAYTGVLATPEGRLQILDMDFHLLGEVDAPAGVTSLSIYLDDIVEPGEILIALT